MSGPGTAPGDGVPPPAVEQSVVADACLLSVVFARSPEGMAFIDPDFVVRAANPSLARQLGIPLEGIVGHPCEQVMPGWKARLEDLCRAARESGRPFEAEGCPLEARAGARPEVTYWDLSVTPVFETDAAFVGCLLLMQEGTERKRAKEERERLLEQLENERSRQEAVLRQLPAGVIIAEAPSGRVTFGNDRVEQIWGRPFHPVASIEEYAQFPAFHPDGRPYKPEEYPLARSIRTGEVVTGEQIDFRRGDGTWGTMSANSAPIRDRPGRIVAAVMAFSDVTEQRQIERRLRESEARFRAIFEGAAIGIALVDPGGRPIESNPALEEMLGYSGAELARMTFAEFTHPDDVARDVELFGELMAGKRDEYQIEKRYVRKNGQVIWGRLTTSLVRGPHGEPQFAIRMVEDVTARKQAETLREEFMALAAHELKTPLTAAKGCAQILMKRGAHDPEELRLFRTINAESDRMAHVVQTLVDFGQIQSGQLILHVERLDLCRLAQDAVRMIQAISPRHQLTVSCAGAALVEADPERIRGVLLNLLDNAVKYSPHGGPVEVTVTAGAGEAIACIRDHGIGIPKEKQAQLFRMFYQVAPMVSPTTGMGLGLYISREIIRMHGGRIWFESQVRQGSTFCFSLRLVAAGNAR